MLAPEVLLKNLRFLLMFCLFALLPAYLVDAGFRVWLDFQRDEQVTISHERMGFLLRELGDEISIRVDKLRIARRIHQDLSRLDLDNEMLVRILIEHYQSLYPGILQLSVFKRTTPLEDATLGESAKFKQVAADQRKYRYLREQLADILEGVQADRYNFALLQERKDTRENRIARRAQMINQRLLARRMTVMGLSSRRQAVTTLFEGTSSISLWWDLVGTAPGLMPDSEAGHGVLLLEIDDQKFDERFTLAELLARKNDQGQADRIRFSCQRLDDTTAIILLRNSESVLPEGYERSGILQQYRGQQQLISTFPVSRDRTRYLLIARKELNHCLPDEQQQIYWIHILLLAWILIVGILQGFIFRGRLKLFISVRTRLIVLFLLAVLVPISALFVFGLRYLRDRETVLMQETDREIENRILAVEEALRAHRREMEESGRALLLCPELSGKRSTAEINLPALKQRFEALKKADLVSGYFVSDGSNKYLLQHDTETGGSQIIENTLLPAIFQGIINFTNTGYHNVSSDGQEKMSLASLVMQENVGIADRLIRNRGIIQQLSVMHWNIDIFFEPIVSPEGKAFAAMGLGFDLRNAYRRTFMRYLEENKTQQNSIHLLGGSVAQAYRRYPQKSDFNETLERFFERAVREKIPVSDTLMIDREIWLARASHLQEAPGLIVIGLASRSEMRKKMVGYYWIFAIICLLSLLVATVIGAVIARKFINPVRHLEEGVRSISEGDLDWRMQIDSEDELGLLAAAFNRMVGGLQEKERMSRYVSEFVLHEVKKERVGKEGVLGERLVGTILFADIRDFTTLSEEHPPEEIVQMLNDYLDAMTRVIRRNGGVVDKFIGDAIMAVFYPDYPPGARSAESRAVIAGLQMRDELARFNQRRREENLFEVENGVGINTGEVIQGTIGSRDHRVDLTVVGDGVNIAARLESLAREGQHTKVMISGSTYKAVTGIIHAEPVGERTVKGKRHTVEVFEVTGLRHRDEYLPLLDNEDPAARCEGVRLLGLLGDPVTVDLLVARLADADPSVRHESGMALKRFESARKKVAAAMFAALEKESHDRVKATLITDLADVAEDHDLLRLERFLDDESPRVRANAIETMGRAKDPTAIVKALRPYLKDANNRIRGNAAVVLWSLGDFQAFTALEQMTLDSDHLMRASGAWGIGEVASRENLRGLEGTQLNPEMIEHLDRSLDLLHGLLEDKHPMVIRNSVKSLGRIGNRRSVACLVKVYNTMADEELRDLILTALEHIGTYRAVKSLRSS